MGHENGGWMNGDQREAVEDAAKANLRRDDPLTPERLKYAEALANDLDARGEIVSAQLVRNLVSRARRASELSDLLTSARAICARRGADTAWERFDDRIASFGIGSVTAKVFKVLPSDTEESE